MSKRRPKCGRCRNHGLLIAVKGHKRFCRWRNCVCNMCLIAVAHQRVVTAQVAMQRQEAQDKVYMQALFYGNYTSVWAPQSSPGAGFTVALPDEATPQDLSLKKQDNSCSPASSTVEQWQLLHNAGRSLDVLMRAFPQCRRHDVAQLLQCCHGDVLQAMDFLLGNANLPPQDLSPQEVWFAPTQSRESP